eukprot:4556847-Alexandrium_andersonii.AAC.1
MRRSRHGSPPRDVLAPPRPGPFARGMLGLLDGGWGWAVGSCLVVGLIADPHDTLPPIPPSSLSSPWGERRLLRSPPAGAGERRGGPRGA